MAVTFNFGTGAQGDAVNKPLKPWAYPSAIRIVSDSGSSARMTDILSPLDMRTTLKVTLDKIANVYTTLADGTVPVAQQSANTSGGTIFAELKTVATKVVGTDTIQIPMVGRIELRLPNDSAITESDVNELVMATYGILCDASGNPTVVTEKLRGALTPAGI